MLLVKNPLNSLSEYEGREYTFFTLFVCIYAFSVKGFMDNCKNKNTFNILKSIRQNTYKYIGTYVFRCSIEMFSFKYKKAGILITYEVKLAYPH